MTERPWKRQANAMADDKRGMHNAGPSAPSAAGAKDLAADLSPASNTSCAKGKGGIDHPKVLPEQPAPSGSQAEGMPPVHARALLGLYRGHRPRDIFNDLLPDKTSPQFPILLETIPGTPQDVRVAVQRVACAATRLGVTEDACNALELVLVEAMNNVVEHAYGNRAEGWILLEVEILADWIVCRISDAGDAMPGNAPPRPAPHDLSAPLEALPEGGFGWLMLHDLTSRLVYRRLCGANCLAFALPVSPG